MIMLLMNKRIDKPETSRARSVYFYGIEERHFMKLIKVSKQQKRKSVNKSTNGAINTKPNLKEASGT